MRAARMKASEEPRTERMELRVRPSAKQAIQRAMALSGLSAADLAFQAARRVLDEHERADLAGADRDAFLDLIARPPGANARLKRAFQRHRRATR
ncbi:MAG: DUF1778 domain-containing protein [Alphaproteobacteria bacterium]|nr:DUF1778 domain-containing protein [Alphaproteobacteria bacterium]